MSNSSSLKVIIWELVRSGGVCVCTSPRFNLTLQHVYIYIYFVYIYDIYICIYLFFSYLVPSKNTVCVVCCLSRHSKTNLSKGSFPTRTSRWWLATPRWQENLRDHSALNVISVWSLVLSLLHLRSLTARP